MVTEIEIEESKNILFILNDISKENNIKIIYSWLGGSRLHNQHNIKSDFDIFFVYEGIKEKYDKILNNISFGGIKHEDFIRHLKGSRDFHKVDALFAKIVYIQNEKFIKKCKNLLPEIDIKIFLSKLRDEIRNICRLVNNSPTTKDYKRALLLAMRHEWIQENYSIIYPVNVIELLKYFENTSWFESANYLYSNLNIISIKKQEKLIDLFHKIMEIDI